MTGVLCVCRSRSPGPRFHACPPRRPSTARPRDYAPIPRRTRRNQVFQVFHECVRGSLSTHAPAISASKDDARAQVVGNDSKVCYPADPCHRISYRAEDSKVCSASSSTRSLPMIHFNHIADHNCAPWAVCGFFRQIPPVHIATYKAECSAIGGSSPRSGKGYRLSYIIQPNRLFR